MTDAHVAELTRLTTDARDIVTQLQALADGDPVVTESLRIQLGSLHAATRRLCDTIQDHLVQNWRSHRLVPTDLKPPTPTLSTDINHGVRVERVRSVSRPHVEPPPLSGQWAHRMDGRRRRA